MPKQYKLDGNTVRNKPTVNYLNKDFVSIKNDLIEYAKSYFPNTYQDFNETSPGMMMMELSAYVGDMLSFYIDQQFKEMFVTTANEKKNIFQLAKSMGYKPKVSSAAFTNILFRHKVPAIGSGPNKSPDLSKAMILDKGTVVKSSVNDVAFQTLEICDFNLTGSRVLPSKFDSSTGVPSEYVLEQYIPCASMTTKSTTFTVSSPQPFLKLNLSETNVLGIESVTDSSGNKWSEVDYLAQDKIYDETHFTNDNSRTNAYQDAVGESIDVPVPYKLNAMLKVNRRFVREVNSDSKTSIIFGNGSLRSTVSNDENTYLDDIFDNTQELHSLVNGSLPNEFDPTISYSSLGEAPANTTLTVKYKVGGGVLSNVPAGTINKIVSYDALTTTHGTDSENSLTAVNLIPAGGGKESETVDEIKQQIKANFSAQNRIITKSDYESRVKALPGRFGNISKVFVKRKGLGELDSSFDMFDLNTDENNDGIPDTPGETGNVGGTADRAAYEELFSGIIGTPAGTEVSINQDQLTFLQDLSNFIGNLGTLSNTEFTGFKNLDIHVLSYDNEKNLTMSPSLLKSNIINYLDNFKSISDEVTIKNAVVINFGIKFKVKAHNNVNKHELKVRCITELKNYFDVENMEIYKPISIPDITNMLYSLDDVKVVDYVKISQNANILGTSVNLYASDGGTPTSEVAGVGPDNYGFAYDFEQFQGPDNNGIIKPAHITTPSIFELKNPNDNIKGVVE